MCAWMVTRVSMQWRRDVAIVAHAAAMDSGSGIVNLNTQDNDN